MDFLSFTLLLFMMHSFLCAPIRNQEEPPTKIRKMDESATRDETAAKCYFTTPRIKLNEKERSTRSKVRKPCKGDLIGFNDLMKASTGEHFGAPNELALILCRGAAECDLDWSQESVKSQWQIEHICSNHRKELSTHWSSREFYHILKSGTSTKCSMDDRVPPSHRETRPKLERRNWVLISESAALLKSMGILIHPGTPVCDQHKEYLSNLLQGLQPTTEPSPTTIQLSQDIFDESNPNSAVNSQHVDGDFIPSQEIREQKKAQEEIDSCRRHPAISESVQKAFFSFADAAEESNVERRKGYCDLSDRHVSRVVTAASRLIDRTFKIMAPDAPEELRRMVLKNDEDGWTQNRSPEYENMMTELSQAFLNAENRRDRLILLGLVANILPNSEIRRYIKGISSYMITKSRMYANEKQVPNLQLPKERYDKEAVNMFVEFITSGTVMIGLPFGVRKAKDSKGNIIEIPNTLRQHRNVDIISMYETYLNELGYDKSKRLSRSTLYKILDKCSATRRKSLTCIDYFIADAADAMDALTQIIEEWKEDPNVDNVLASSLLSFFFFLHFGKRGISYHVTHVAANVSGFLKTHSYIHVVRTDLQDSQAVVAILNHTLKDLIKRGISKVVLRSDNAGCYHSSGTVASLIELEKSTGIDILRYSFSESQDGKSACDRVASQIKRKARDFVDSGGDADTVDAFFNALVDGRQLRAISVYLGDIVLETKSTAKIAQISNLQSFAIFDDHIIAYRYFGIGTGKVFPLRTLHSHSSSFSLEKEDVPGDKDFWAHSGCTQEQCTIADLPEIPTRRKSILQKMWPKEESTITKEEKEIFSCPFEGCTQRFLRYSSVLKHMDTGIHKLVLEKETLLDYALKTYAQNLEEVKLSSTKSFVTNAVSSIGKTSDTSEVLEEGWALKKHKAISRYSEEAKRYIEKIFAEGARTKQKIDSKTAAKRMAAERKADGTFMFSLPERLNARQIQSYWSRMNAKQKNTAAKSKRDVNYSYLNQEDDEGDFQLLFRKEAFTAYEDDEIFEMIDEFLDEIFESDSPVLGSFVVIPS